MEHATTESPFLILSTCQNTDGELDMNVLTPYGVVTFEFKKGGSAPPIAGHPVMNTPVESILVDRRSTRAGLKAVLLDAVADLANSSDIDGEIAPVQVYLEDDNAEQPFHIMAN